MARPVSHAGAAVGWKCRVSDGSDSPGRGEREAAGLSHSDAFRQRRRVIGRPFFLSRRGQSPSVSADHSIHSIPVLLPLPPVVLPLVKSRQSNVSAVPLLEAMKNCLGPLKYIRPARTIKLLMLAV